MRHKHNNSGVKNLGGLTVGLEKGEILKIGDDIKIIVQKNNSPGSKKTLIRIIAPKNIIISRSSLDAKALIRKQNDT